MCACSGLVSLQREQAALRAIEEQHEREEKRREQEATKVALDRSLKLKLRRKVSGCDEKGSLHALRSIQACIHTYVHVDQTATAMPAARATVDSSCREQV